MFMKKRQNIRKFISLVFLGIAIGMVANNIVFRHTHIIDGKYVISHSHPFDQSTDSDPVKKHHHSLFDYFSLQGFGIFLLAQILVLLTILEKKDFIPIPMVHGVEDKFLSAFQNKGPPSPAFL